MSKDFLLLGITQNQLLFVGLPLFDYMCGDGDGVEKQGRDGGGDGVEKWWGW